MWTVGIWVLMKVGFRLFCNFTVIPPCLLILKVHFFIFNTLQTDENKITYKYCTWYDMFSSFKYVSTLVLYRSWAFTSIYMSHLWFPLYLLRTGRSIIAMSYVCRANTNCISSIARTICMSLEDERRSWPTVLALASATIVLQIKRLILI